MKKNNIENLEEMIALFFLVTILSALILLSSYAGERVSAAELPTPDTVYESYKNNPYLRFYEGEKGIAWTTIHPGGYSITSHGTYIYGGGVSIYRGEYGKAVIPDDVVSRKELQGPLPAGHHYYAAPLKNTVIPVGKWVVSHVDSRCVHGPFSACRDYEYYGLNGLSNVKCGRPYDSGWKAYCADCGEEIIGYVYASDDCVKRIGYIFVGDSEFRKNYPAEYLFICPICGDNLENDICSVSHNCKSFVSANRYKIVYNGNGAERGNMEASICYFGGAAEYEGKPVSGATSLKENEYVNPGYKFAGWTDSPDGQVLFCDGASAETIENYFTYLSDSGDGSNDREITLYAVWVKFDCALNVSGGFFGDSAGSYGGVEYGSFEAGKNSFNKGYMYETNVRSDDLVAPGGYKVSLMGPGGVHMKDVYAGSELIGWRFDSDDPNADSLIGITAGTISYYGKVSGEVTGVSSSGNYTYIHSSDINNNTDYATAIWKSTTLVLPEGYYPGYIFEGWYSDPGLTPDSYVGGKGDIFRPESDTILYASFAEFDLEVSPDYMGNDSFGDLRYSGLTDLKFPKTSGYDVFKYYISSEYPEYDWKEVSSDINEVYGSEARRIFDSEGSYSEYIAPVAGIYTLDLWGGAGASYAGYPGENGEYSSCKIFLNKGDVVGIYTGASGKAVNNEGIIDCYGGEGSYITVNGKMILSSAGGNGAEFVLNVRKEFEYTGDIETFVVETDGDYMLEVWGASGSPTSGGTNLSGSGGYAKGELSLESGTVLYVCVGGRNGYNGGGAGGRDAYGGHGGSGGGATHIAYMSGQLRSLSRNRDKVCLVAGGGGGSAAVGSSAGTGGGLRGTGGQSYWPGGETSSMGGEQNRVPSSCFAECNAGFGYGGRGFSYSPDSNISAMIDNGGGGGGWYGGTGGTVTVRSYGCGGAGGSGYIGGVNNGSMSNGVRSGNGLAVISVSVNIYGSCAVGEDTGFDPGDLLYADHVVKDHENSVYPEADEDKNGYCIITEPSENYYNDSDAKILSPDTSSPDAVSDVYFTYDPDTRNVTVYWDMPDDKGTKYYYMAGAYRSSDIMAGENLCANTDIKNLDIKTGVYSYRYLIDDVPGRDNTYVYENGTDMKTAWAFLSGSSPDAEFAKWYEKASTDDLRSAGVSLTPDGNDRYIHIVSVDRAGNVSEVCNAAVDGDGAHIPYPLITEEIKIIDAPNVYADESREKTYYVRADGVHIFQLEYSAYISGFARTTYQPDVARIHTSESEYAQFSFDKNPNVKEDAEACLIDSSYFGPFIYQSIGVRDAFRSSESRRLSFTGEFATLSEGETFIYPTAHAHIESGGLISSNTDADRRNGITLIGDGTAPECYVSVNGSGYERLRECDISNVSTGYVVDRRGEDVNIDLYVTDSRSGLKGGFDIHIVNSDNGLEEYYHSDGDHYLLSLKADENSEDPCFVNMLFNGRFFISVTSEDNVGNTGTEESAGLTELDVNGEIIRILDTITGPLTDADGNLYIKRGESGYVLSKVWGYPDAVLVSFADDSLREYDVLYVTGDSVPDEFADYTGTVVMIDKPEYYLEQQTAFTIPLDYPSDDITVTITAYKGDECITWEARCMVISSGSVLDELMTVLR